MFKQGLFWNIVDPALPKGESKNLSFLRSALRHTYLQPNYTSSPKSFVVFTGTTSIDFRRFERILNKELIESFNKNGLDFYLYEPLSLYSLEHNRYNRFFFSEFNSLDSLDSIRAGELDSVAEFAKKHNLTNINVNTCDYRVNEVFGTHYPALNLYCRDIFLRTVTTKHLPAKNPENIKKIFWAGNSRYAVHRHAVTSYIAPHLGRYSWHFVCTAPAHTIPNTWIESSVIDNEHLDKLTTGNTLLNKRYRYIDFKFDSRQEVSDAEHFKFANPPSEGDADLTTKYLQSAGDCAFAIISETRFAQPTGNVSEKTFNAIATSTPFILVAPPRSLEYLRNLGFRTFSSIWDESYDLEENHSKRLNMIFDVIDYLSNKSINELKEMYKKIEDVIDHNKKILRQFPSNQEITNEKNS